MRADSEGRVRLLSSGRLLVEALARASVVLKSLFRC